MEETKRDTKVYKVVGAHELEKWTSVGWRLEKLVTDQRIEERMDSIPLVVPYSGGGGGGVQMQCVARSHTVALTLFLLCKEEGTYIEQLQADYADLGVQLKAGMEEYSALTKELAIRTKELELKTTLYASTSEILTQANRNHTVTKELNQKLEKDIAKIRTAVGDLRMQEILGAK